MKVNRGRRGKATCTISNGRSGGSPRSVIRLLRSFSCAHRRPHLAVFFTPLGEGSVIHPTFPHGSTCRRSYAGAPQVSVRRKLQKKTETVNWSSGVHSSVFGRHPGCFYPCPPSSTAVRAEPEKARERTSGRALAGSEGDGNEDHGHIGW